MAQLPPMPQQPAAGQASGQEVWDAHWTRKQRANIGGLTQGNRGDDIVTAWNITAQASAQAANLPANLPAILVPVIQQFQAGQVAMQQQLAAMQQQLGAGLAGQQQQLAAMQQQQQAMQQQQQAMLQQGVQVLARLDQLGARLDNTRARTLNTTAQQVAGTPLTPLVKEQPPLAGGAAAGALPPPNMHFPPTWAAVEQLTTAQLNALQAFYGQQFAGAGLQARRAAFAAFIKL